MLILNQCGHAILYRLCALPVYENKKTYWTDPPTPISGYFQNIGSHEKMKCHFFEKMQLQTLGPKTVGVVLILLGIEHQSCSQSMQLV